MTNSSIISFDLILANKVSSLYIVSPLSSSSFANNLSINFFVYVVIRECYHITDIEHEFI